MHIAKHTVANLLSTVRKILIEMFRAAEHKEDEGTIFLVIIDHEDI